MIGDGLKAVNVAIDRDRFQRLASLSEHSSGNLRRRQKGSRAMQQISQKLLIDAVFPQQEVAQAGEIQSLASAGSKQDQRRLARTGSVPEVFKSPSSVPASQGSRRKSGSCGAPGAEILGRAMTSGLASLMTRRARKPPNRDAVFISMMR
jgi:hypothetical protein